jgi:hypothetical protein
MTTLNPALNTASYEAQRQNGSSIEPNKKTAQAWGCGGPDPDLFLCLAASFLAMLQVLSAIDFLGQAGDAMMKTGQLIEKAAQEFMDFVGPKLTMSKDTLIRKIKELIAFMQDPKNASLSFDEKKKIVADNFRLWAR